jgi:hypothetical protein
MGRSGAFILAAGTICVFAQTPALAFDGDERSFTRVRGVGGDMHRLIHEADGLSRTFQSLVDEIQRSDAIVMVQFGLCASGQFRSCVMHVTGDDRQRHIRILVNTRTTGDRLLATIAHELQHAVEIVRDPQARDAESALALFRRIAMGKCKQGLSDACETAAAQEVEGTVLRELYAARSR